MKDKDGQPRTEVVMAQILLDNAVAGRKVRVDYGKEFWDSFQSVDHGGPGEEDDADLLPVKSEPSPS